MRTDLQKRTTPTEAGYYLWQDPNKPESKAVLVELVQIKSFILASNQGCDFYCVGGGRGYFIPRDAVGMWSEKQDIYED